MKKTYTPVLKARIVRELLKEEKSVSQLATEYGLHPNQLYRWRDIAIAGLPSLFDRRTHRLAAKEAAHERRRKTSMLKSASLPLSSPGSKKATLLTREERLALLDRTEREVPLRTQADLLSLNRSSLYYVAAPPLAEELGLKHRIDEILHTMAILRPQPSRSCHQPRSRQSRASPCSQPCFTECRVTSPAQLSRHIHDSPAASGRGSSRPCSGCCAPGRALRLMTATLVRPLRCAPYHSHCNAKECWSITRRSERHMREMGLAGIAPGPKPDRRSHAHAVYPYLLRNVRAASDHVWGIEIV